MQSIRNSGEDRSERRGQAVARRNGLFTTTALIPAMATLASGASRKGAASLLHSTALVPAAIAVAAASLLVMPDIALAQTSGGRGGNNLGSGGASSETGVGGDGAGNANSGGGGGAGVTGGSGGNGGGAGGASAGANGSAGVAAGSGGGGGAHGYFGASVLGSAAIGGNGGVGAVSAVGVNRGGGGGGAGGFGAVVTGTGNLGTLNVNVAGGTGGLGGNGGAGSFGGYGGSGGVGLALTANAANLTVNSSVTGGNGGSGGAIGSAGGGAAGVAGNGGVGLNVLGTNSIITIGASGSVTGGNSGPALNGAGQSNGGIGITGSNLTLVVGGSVSAGTGVFGRANAVSFTGGTNVLEILSGATFLGNVVANSGADTLRLGGTSNGTFNAGLIGSSGQFRNFGVYEKAGTSTWTLTGSTSATTPWAINGGTLSISADNNLGATGAISFGGGVLATTAEVASARNVTLNAGGGTISPATATTLTLSGVIGGTGALTKADLGTLILSGTNIYNGTTTISAGTLQIGNGGATGAIGAGSITNNATLAFNRADAITVSNIVSGTGTLRKLGAGVTTLSGAITQGAVVVEAGTLALNAANTIGGITVSGGTLRLGATGAAGGTTGQITTTGSVIDYANGIDNTTPIQLNSNTTQLQVTTGAATQSGVISETGGARPLEKIGAGTLTLTGANTYSGLTTISGGVLSITSDAALGAASGGLAIGTAALQLNSTQSSARRINLTGNASIISTTGSNWDLTGAITGNGSLTKNGAGTLVLSGTNAYDGATTISLGTLQIGNGGTTGTLGRDDIANNASLVFNRSNDLTVANRITGTGSLTKLGAGTLVLTGLNTYAGGTTISAGTLQLGSVGGSPGMVGSGAVSIASGASLRFDGGSNKVVSGAISGDGSITVAGTGSAILDNANNTFTGGTTVNSGTLVLAGAASAGTGTIRINGGTLQANASFTLTNRLTVAQGADVRIVTAPGVALTKTGDQTNPLDLVGTLRIATTGTGANAGTFRFSSAATTTGSARLIVESGTFLNTTMNVLPAVLNIIELTQIDAAGTLNLGGITFGGTDGIRNLQGSGTLINNGATTTIRGGSFSGNLSGTQNVVSAGALALSGANTFSGTTTVSSGTLTISSSGALGTTVGGTTVSSGAALALAGSLNVGNEALSISGTGVSGTGALRSVSGTNSFGGTISLLANARINSDGTRFDVGAVAGNGNGLSLGGSGALIVNASISGLSSLVKDGTGGAALFGTNSFTGATTVNNGVLDLFGGSSLSDTALLTVNSPAFARFVASETIGSLTGSGTVVVLGGRTLTVGGDNSSTEFAGIIQDTGDLTKTGNGTFTLSGANAYGATTISTGVLQVGNGGATGTLGNGAVTNNAALVFNRSNDFTTNSAISGSGTLTKRGVGQMTLGGANAYAGATTVVEGTLRITSAAGLGTSAGGTAVLSGATLALAGAGGLGDAITLSGTGVGGLGALRALSGTQTLSGNITLDLHSLITAASGATLTFQPSVLQGNAQRLTFDNAGTITANNSIANLEALTKNGSGLLTLAGTNTSIGSVVVNAGTLRTQNGGGLPDNAAVTVNAGATLDIDSVAPEGIGSLAGAGFVTVSNASGSLGVLGSDATTFSGQISGVGGLSKSGTGTLTLSGTNSYGRITDILGGTLVVQGGAALPDAALLFVGAGGTLRVEAGETIGGFGGTGNIVLATTGPLIADVTQVQSFGGVISQSGSIGSFTKRGAGTQIFTTAQTYTGLTSVDAGTLSLTGAGALASTNVNTASGTTLSSDGGAFASSAVITHAGTLTLTGGETISSISGAGNIAINAFTLTTGDATDATLSGVISGAGSLVKMGTGTLTLTGANTFAGGLNVNNGALALVRVTGGVFDSVGTGPLAFRGTSELRTTVSGTLNSQFRAIGASTSILAATGTTLRLASSAFEATGNAGSSLNFGSAQFGGTIELAPTLVTTGNPDDFINVNGGTLRLINTASLNLISGFNAMTLNGAVLGIDATGAITRPVNIGALGATIDVAATSIELRGAGAIGGILTKTGTGDLRFAAANTGNGTVRLNAGMLSLLTDASTFGTGTLEMATGTTLRVPLASDRILANNIVLGADAGSGISAPSLILSGALSGGRLNVVGDGPFAGPTTLILAGTNTYGSTSIATGNTLQIGNFGLTGTLGTGDVSIGTNATLRFRRLADFAVSNAISGAGRVVKDTTNTLTLTGNNSYAGTTTVSQGTLQIGNGGTSGSLGTGSVTNNGTLAINLASDITLAQQITGTGTLTKLGSGAATVSGDLALGSATVQAGTLLLSGSNSFTNGITVAGGTLALRSANAAGGATGIIRTTGSVIDYSDGLVMATPIQLNSNTTQLQVLTGLATQSGVISESGGAHPLEKIGAGTLTLSGVNTYSGGTVITAGQLNVGSNAGLGAIAGGLTIGNGVLGSTATFSSARTVALTGAAGIDVATGTGLTLTGAVSGTGGLAKTGAGQLVLTANNSYAGTTTISGLGGLTVGSGGATGSLGTGNVVVNSGSFLAFSRSDAFTVANAISGLGSLGKQGSGMMTLTGSNSFSGGLGIAAGTVVLGSAAGGVINAAGTGTVQLLANSTLRSDVSGTLANTLSLSNANVTVAAATGTTLRLASSQLFFEAGAGSPLNFGTSTATGTIELAPLAVTLGAAVNPINVNGGTLRLSNVNAFTLLNGSTGITLNGATLGADVVGTLARPFLVGSAGGTIDVAASSLTLQSDTSFTGGLTKTGAGELRLTGAVTGPGTVQLNAGTLALVGNTGGWGTGTLQMATGTSLLIDNVLFPTYANTIILGAGAGSNILSRNTAISGTVSGGPLNVGALAGSNFLVLSGNNTYSATNIAAGVRLQIGSGGTTGTLGTGAVTVGAGAVLSFVRSDNQTVGNAISGAGSIQKLFGNTLTLTGTNNYSGTTTVSGGTLQIGSGGTSGSLGSGNVLNSGALVFNRSDDMSVANVIRGTGSLQKLGSGVLTLTGANTFTGATSVDNGTLRLGSATASGSANALSISTGAAVEAQFSQTFGSLSGNGRLSAIAGGGAGPITFAAGADNSSSTFGGQIGQAEGIVANLRKMGSGTLILTGANSYTGQTFVDTGVLQVGTGGTTGVLGSGAVQVTSTLAFNRSDVIQQSQLITGTGTINQNGAGTLNLGFTNGTGTDFTGTINVNSGTLLVSGSIGDVTARTAQLNVANGATLAGSGTFNGNVVVANGGILSPGTSPGTQTIAGNLTLSDSSILNFELAQAGVAGGGINDLISVGGNLTLDGILNVTALPGFGPGFYRLFDYGGTLTDNRLALGTLPLGFTSSILTDIAGQVNVLFNAGTQTVQYWDGADTSGAAATVNGDGGAGSWTSTATNWTTPTGFAVNSAWAGQAGVFAGAAGGVVGVTGTQAFQELRFLTNGYTLNPIGPTGGLATTGGFSIVNVDTGISTRFNTPISGAAGLTKTGTGTLTLAGANSYFGPTTVSAGTLSLLSSGVIAGAVQNNATLANTGTITGLLTNAGTLTSTGTIGGGLINNAAANANIAGTLNGTVTNSGTVTLTGATTGNGAFTQNAGGVFNLAGFDTSFGSISGTGAVQLDSGTLTTGGNNASTSFAGVISGSGGLAKTGTGTLTISGANAFSGTTLVNDGQLALATGASLSGSVINNAALISSGTIGGALINFGTATSSGTLNQGFTNFTGAVAFVSGQVSGNVQNLGTIALTGQTTGIRSLSQTAATFNLGGFNTTIGSLTGTGTVQLGNAVLTTGGDNASSTFNGGVFGTGGLNKTGTGSFNLSGQLAYTGLTTVSAGTLTIGNGSTLAGAVQNNASLTNAGVIGSLVINAASLSSTNALNGGVVNNAAATALVRGTLNGPVTNSGTITLTGATTGIGAFTQDASGVLDLAGFSTSIGSLSGSGAVQLGSGTLTTGSGGSSIGFSGVISGSGGLTKTGAGTLTLSGANTFAGLTTINQGSLAVSSTGSLAGAVQNSAGFSNAGVVSGLVTNTGTLSSNGRLGGGLINAAGATAILADVVTGSITNSGAITLAGGVSGITTLSQNLGGSFNLAGFNTTLGSISGNGSVQLGGGTLTTGGNNSSTGFDGVISGAGTFSKTGTGTLALGGSNTTAANFTGDVSVIAGTLLINGQFGDTVANAANLTVGNGATLGGSGNFLGNIALGAGSILAPGNSPGTLAIAGNLLLAPTSVLNFELAQAGVVGGGINDLITVGGNLTLDGMLNVTSLPGFGAGIYRLFNYGGTLTDNGLALGMLPGGLTSSLVTSVAGQISVQFVQGMPTILYWDGADATGASNATNGNGRGGIWNSTATNWTSAPNFNTNFAWGSQTGVFSGATGGAVEIVGAQAFQQLRFEQSGYRLFQSNSGGELATTGGFSIIDVSTGVSASIDARISGTGGLTKIGSGTLNLAGLNSYTGLTNINAGTLRLSTAGTLVGTVQNDATFSNEGIVTGQVTNTGTLISIGRLNGGLVNAAGASAGIAGQLNGAVSNSGSVALTGTTTGIGALTQTAIGTLNLAGFGTTLGSLSGSGSVQLGSGSLTTGGDNSSTNFAGVISGSGGLNKTGTGTFALSGANTYTRLTTINAGRLAVAAGGVIAGAVQNNASLSNAGTVSGLVTNAGTLASTGTLGGGLTNAAGAIATIAGQFSGAITNSGAITLTGATTGIGAVTQNAGATLNLAGFNTTLGSLAGTGALLLGSGTLTTGGNNASTSFAGVISGPGGVAKTGAGTFALSGANTYTGPTQVNGGALTITANGSLAGTVVNNATLNSTGTLNGRLTNEAGATANISGALNNIVINRGTLNLTGTTTGIGELTMATGSVFNLGGFATTVSTLAGDGGTIALGSATLTLGSGSQSQTFDGTITGTGGVTKLGANTFSLSGAQSYTGPTSNNGGTFILGTNASLAGALVNNAAVSTNGRIAGLVTNNGTLISTGTLNGGLVNTGGATANLRGTVAGAISNAGTITLTGAASGIGAVTQAGTGNFVLSGISTSFGSLAGSGTVRLSNGAVLTTGSNNASTSFAGVITGAGGLTKTGTGTFTLTGANDFAGLAMVNAGALVIGTGGALAGGVANNANFTNAGTVTGAVANAGTLVSTGMLNGALINNAGALALLSGQLNNTVTNAGNIALTGATSGIGAISQVTGGSFDLAGNSTSVGSLLGAGAIQLGSAVLTTGADNASTTFAGAISGAGALTKTGNGTFSLTGANSYAGLTTVAAGALSIQNNASLGTAEGGTTVNAGAALELQGGITVTGESLTISDNGIANGGALRNVSGNNFWAGTVTLGADSRIVTVADRLDIALLAGTTQNLTVAGAGLTGLSGATTSGMLTVVEGSTALFGSGNFVAGVNVNAGSLFLQGGASINDSAAVTLGTGNLIVAVSEAIGSLAGAGTVQIDAGQSLTLGGNGTSTSFGGVIFNTGNLVKHGAGTFTATGTLAHTGTTSINGGTLLSGAANLWQGNGLVTITTGGTLDLGSFDQSIANIALAGGTLTNGVLAGAISSNGGTINGITGTANTLVTTAGTTTLTGAGSFALGVTLSGGDLSLQGNGASIDDAAAVTINAGTLTLGASETVGSLTGGAGRIQLGGATLTTGGNNVSTGFAGVISGAGGLTKAGSGTFTLSGANSYTGFTTVNAGVLALTTGGTIAGAVQNNAVVSNAGTVAGSFTNAGTLISTGTLNGGLANSGSTGLAGVLNGAVSNSGLTQLQGALTGIGAFSQTATGMFDLAGFNTSIGGLSGAGSVLLGSATLTTGGNNGSTSFGGLISGTGGLGKTGSGTFTLTSGHSFTGLTMVSGGTLAITSSGGLTGSVLNNATFASAGLVLGGLTNNATALLAGQINGPIANNGTITGTGEALFLGRFTQAGNAVFNLAGFNTQAGSLAGGGSIQLGSGFLTVGGDNSSSTFGGVIGGSGGLVKIGTGTFTLSGVNSYAGTTFVNAGTLVIGAGAAAAAPAWTVATIGAASAVSSPAGTGAVAGQAAADAILPVVVASAVAVTPEQATPFTRADMLHRSDSLGGGRMPASLSSSAAGVGLSADLKSGPERVDLFADPVNEAAITAPVLTGIASAPVTRLAMISSLGNGLGTASLDAGVASAIAPGPEAVSLAAAPAAGADNAAQAGTLSTAVIAGNVVNRAIVINNGTIRGQLANATGATTTNNGVIIGNVFNDGLLVSTGTLSGGLSNNGTARIAGVLTGDVFNTGAITLTGTTTGIAVFQQAATGTLNLAGFDTTLGALSGTGTVALGSARLTTGINGISSLFSGAISGAGGLTKTGTGGFILTGENLYTGGTTIAVGFLQLGNGGTGGSILGPVTNNGTLIVNRSNAYTLASIISGTGMFVQGGSGTTTLTGANTYTGGTLVSAGRLVGSTTSLQGVIQNDAALEFAQAANGVFAGRIGGIGAFDKTDAGLLELIGDNSSLRGVTTVRSGELRVIGALSGSATTVLAGATLSGTGTLGGLIARSGSIVSPGNGAAGTAGLGALGVNGAIQLQSGSTLRLQLQAASGSDMLVGNATAQIAGIAAISNLGGTYAFNSNYLLLQASGGRNGTFETVTGLGDFGILYRPELVYTGTQVLLRMAPNLLTNIVGVAPLTANQRSVVSRIDAAVTAGFNPQPLFNVYSLPTAQLPGAFDQLSGEIYATAAGVGIEQERLVREAVLSRVGAVASASREAPDYGNGAGAWAQLFGSWGDGDGNGNSSRFETDRQGFITGIDYGNANTEGSWRIGAYCSKMTSKVSVDRLGSRAEVEQTGGGIYAGVNSDSVSVATGVSLANVDLTGVRNITLPGFAETNRGQGHGTALQGFAELSYSIEAGRATYRPFVSAAAGSFKLDAMTETGGAAALVVRRQSYASGSITAGIDGTIRMDKVTLSGEIAGRVQIGDRDPQALVALASAPAQAFGVRGVQIDSFAIAARLDATVRLGRNADLSVGYSGLIGDDTTDHGARATVSIRF